jgi:hypothetical protein
VLTCLDEFEVRHALDLVENKKYRELQHAIQNNPRVLREIEGVLGSDYVFQDYMSYPWRRVRYRRVTGMRMGKCSTTEWLTHPTYTMLFFLEPMDCVPGRHSRLPPTQVIS